MELCAVAIVETASYEAPGDRAIPSLMSETEYRSSRCCRVVGSPICYRVLKAIGTGRRRPTEIAVATGRSLSVVSRALRHLREIDLVRYDVEAGRTVYWLKRPEVLDLLLDLERLVCALRVQRW